MILDCAHHGLQAPVRSTVGYRNKNFPFLKFVHIKISFVMGSYLFKSIFTDRPITSS